MSSWRCQKVQRALLRVVLRVCRLPVRRSGVAGGAHEILRTAVRGSVADDREGVRDATRTRENGH